MVGAGRLLLTAMLMHALMVCEESATVPESRPARKARVGLEQHFVRGEVRPGLRMGEGRIAKAKGKSRLGLRRISGDEGEEREDSERDLGSSRRRSAQQDSDEELSDISDDLFSCLKRSEEVLASTAGKVQGNAQKSERASKRAGLAEGERGGGREGRRKAVGKKGGSRRRGEDSSSPPRAKSTSRTTSADPTSRRSEQKRRGEDGDTSAKKEARKKGSPLEGFLGRPSFAYRQEGEGLQSEASESEEEEEDEDDEDDSTTESSTEEDTAAAESDEAEQRLWGVTLDGRVSWRAGEESAEEEDEEDAKRLREMDEAEEKRLRDTTERRALHSYKVAQSAPRLQRPPSLPANSSLSLFSHRSAESVVLDYGLTMLAPFDKHAAKPTSSLQSSSHALVLDAADAMARDFQKDTEFLASIPYRRAGGVPEFIERRRAQILNAWATTGILPSDPAALKEVGAMLGLKSGGGGPGDAATGPPLNLGGSAPAAGASGEAGEGLSLLAPPPPLSSAPDYSNSLAESGFAIVPSAHQQEVSVAQRSEVQSVMQADPWDPVLDARERELVVLTKKTKLRSSNDANFFEEEERTVVVPRWAAERYAGEQERAEVALAAWEGGRREGQRSLILSQTDKAGNTALALKTGTSNQQLVVAKAPRKSPSEQRLHNLTATYEKQARKDSKLTAKEYVDKYREEVHALALATFKGPKRNVQLIEQIARSSSTGALLRGKRVDRGGLSLSDSLSHVPKNAVMPLKELFRMKRKLTADYDKAKADAKAQGMDVTPALIKAKEALRYSGGTRNDIIAKGARFGKTAEWKELKKRRDKRLGKRRGPHGLMNRPS